MVRLTLNSARDTNSSKPIPTIWEMSPSNCEIAITEIGSQEIVAAAPTLERPFLSRTPRSWTKMPHAKMIRGYPKPVMSGPPSMADCSAGQASQVAAISRVNADAPANFSIPSRRLFSSALTASSKFTKPSILSPPRVQHIRISVLF